VPVLGVFSEWSSQVEAVARITTALLAGMLIGLEREKARMVSRRRRQKPEIEELIVKEVPGLRTFSLIAVYSAIVGFLWDKGYISSVQASVLLSIFGIIVAIFASQRLLILRSTGITTITVMLVDFAIGLMAGLGLLLAAASIAVLSTFMLAIKLPAERVVGRIRYEELLWALELGVILIVVGPFFLASSISFYGISLKSLYLFFVLVLATSYAGYVMARLKGGEGIAYTAIFGGLASSEATVLGILSILDEESRRLLAFDITLLSNTAMILRNIAIAGVMAYASSYKPFGTIILAPLLVSALTASIPALFSWNKLRGRVERVELAAIENPLQLSTAAKMTLFYILIAFAAYIVRHIGFYGLLPVALAGGFVSSGATLIALFSVPGIDVRTLILLSLAAIAVSVINKVLYVYMGGWRDKVILSRVFWSTILQTLLLAPGLSLAFTIGK
jgi:uncharacterized membrane protein (DUF4010 family)